VPTHHAAPTSAVRYGLGAALALAALAWCLHRPSAPATPIAQAMSAASARAAVAGAATACAVDLRCAAEQALLAADPACSQAIAQLAAFGLRWTTNDPSLRYAGRVWLDERQGAIRYSGDRAEFEAGSGRYRRVRYECDFDPGQRAVLDVRALPA
jgi:hypothetical protein